MTIGKPFFVVLNALGALSMFLLVMIFNTLQSNSNDIKADRVKLAKIETSVVHIAKQIEKIETKLESDTHLYAYVEAADGE
ncbi:TPA: hypothetical protein ACRZZI_004974 [Vibrio harveyi]